MELSIILLVLFAAFLHASWNAMVKTSGDRLIVMACIMTIAGLCSAIFIPFVGIPAKESWFFILLSVVIHTAYYFSLISAYTHGDLSHVYPLARGIAPIMILIGGIIFAVEIPTLNQWLGVMIASIGIMSLAFEKGLPWRSDDKRPLFYALLTGFWIASYTLTDGLGVRASENPLAYICWLFFLECWPLMFYTLYKRKGQVLPFLKSNLGVCLGGGIASAMAYGIVIYALGLGFMAGVSALRETSVVIATLIGIFLFKEDNTVRRICAGVVVAAGVILMNYQT